MLWKESFDALSLFSVKWYSCSHNQQLHNAMGPDTMSHITIPEGEAVNENALAAIQLLNPFCEKMDGHRLYLKQPFVIDGYLCASDGYKLVAIPAPQGVETELLPLGMPADVQKKLGDVIKFARQMDVPQRPFPSLKITKAPEKIPCKECKGKGSVSFSNSFNAYECECLTCEGAGGDIPAHLMSVESETQFYKVFTLLQFSKLPISGWVETSADQQLKGFWATLHGGGFAYMIAQSPPLATDAATSSDDDDEDEN